MMRAMPAISEYEQTIWLGALAVFVTSRAHFGFFLFFLVPVFIAWVPYSLFIIWRQAERRKSQAIRLVIYALLLTSMGCLHWYYAHAARHDADVVVQKLALYKAQHGTFPPTLADVGLDADRLKQSPKLFYSAHNDQPSLFYLTTFTLFETYSYDFQKQEWHYNPD